MKKNIKTLTLLLFLSVLMIGTTGTQAFAKQAGIAAVVNDRVISNTDVYERMHLGIVSSNMPDTEDTKKRLRPQILSNLINEVLQMEEAEKLGINISEAEIEDGLKNIAQQNGKSLEAFKKDLERENVSINSISNQIRTQIAWGQVVRRKLRPKVNISEGDIDNVIEQMQLNAGKPEYLVAEIFLGVDHPSKENVVRGSAMKLIEHLKGGAGFPSLARQFSQAPGAGNGGDMGWVQETQLSNELRSALGQMQPGQISPPIKSVGGYHILFLREKRMTPDMSSIINGTSALSSSTLDLKRLFIPVAKDDPEAIVTAKIARAKTVGKHLDSCFEMEAEYKNFENSLTGDMGQVPLNNLPPQILEILSDLPVGTPSKPIAAQEGIAILMICGRNNSEPAQSVFNNKRTKEYDAIREQIATQLGLEHLNKLQQRYLQDLRATAFIETRL